MIEQKQNQVSGSAPAQATPPELCKHYKFDVSIYDMGKYSFKGIAGSYSVLQVNLATLAGRTDHYPKELPPGKAQKVEAGRGLVDVRTPSSVPSWYLKWCF